MRLIPIIVAGMLLTVAGAAPAARAVDPEAKIAKVLEGRIAGDPVDCINLRDIRSSQIIDGTAILYDTGRRLYLNRPESGASWLDHYDILVTDTHSPQLCSIDIVRLVDQTSGFQSGSVALGKFVPYSRTPKAARGESRSW